MKIQKILSFCLLAFTFSITGCNKCEPCPCINDINVGDPVYSSSNDESDYSNTKTSEVWDQEMINSVLKYRQTEILPAAEGTFFEYNVGFRTVDIMITGKINSYLDILKSNGYRVPKKPSIAIPVIGLRSYYGCYSKNDTLKVYVYPVDDEHFEIEAVAKLPAPYSDTFDYDKVVSRLDELTYFYPYAEPVTPYIVVPTGEIFSIKQSDYEYFVVDAYVELGNYEEYEQELVRRGYVKDDDHKYHMGNLGCDIHDIDANNHSYNIKFYVSEIPQFDYEHYVANYNNGNYTFPVISGEREIVLVFDNGTISCNPPRTIGVDVESQRTTLNYDRIGCSSPTMLHIYGQDKYFGRYYDFIIDYNFFSRIVFIAEDNSHY